MDQTANYPSAAENQTFALIDGVWQWTADPTPGAANILVQPDTGDTVNIAKATSSAAIKTASVKTPKAPAAPKTPKPAKASTAKSTLAATLTTVAAAATPILPAQIWWWLIVGAAILIIAYGGYEFRHEVANYYDRARRLARPGRKTGI